MLASIGAIFTILVPTLFPVAGKAYSNIGRAASLAKSNIRYRQQDREDNSFRSRNITISAVLYILATILDYGNRIAKTTSGMVLQP